MRAPKRLSLACLLTWGALLPSASGAAEMLVIKPDQAPLIEFGTAIGKTSKSSWLETLSGLPSSEIGSGLMVSMPIDLSGLHCATSPQDRLTIFSIEGDGSAIPLTDPRGLTALALDFVPDDGTIEIRSTIRPLIAGKRATTSLTYKFKILDRFWSLEKICSGNKSISLYSFNIYMNAYNIVVEATPRVSGMAKFYLSPVNMGMGDYLWNKLQSNPSGLTVGGDFGYNIAYSMINSNTKVKFYGVDWSQDLSRDVSLRYNVKDSLNYNYGAKAYPVKSPTLNQTRAAAALIGLILR